MTQFLSDHNNEEADRIKDLIAGFIRGSLTEQEQDELDEWVSSSNENLLLFEDLTDEKNIEESLRFLETIETGKALLRTKVKAGIRIKKARNWSYSIAASIIIIIGAFVIVRPFSRNKVEKPETAENIPDALPGEHKASLTLADGTVVLLDSLKAGERISQSEGTIIHTGAGELQYESSTSVSHEMNVLTVPRGGHYRLQLSDGTKIWMNAASTLRFPNSFNGSNSRSVQLVGEAYFEVAHDAVKPFNVTLRDSSEVQVLGTTFNIDAYADEDRSVTTLVSGSVRVKGGTKDHVLKPREQAIMSGTENIRINRYVDTEEIIAWKNGNFEFKNASLETIMRQAARWYDVKVVYQAKISEEFNVDLSRNEPLSKLLRLLELTKRVHFKIENKTVYVLP